MARASIDYAERAGFHIETLGGGKAKVEPKTPRFATNAELLEEAKWAYQVHKLAVVVPTQRGWFTTLVLCLQARDLNLPLDADVDNLWEVSR